MEGEKKYFREQKKGVLITIINITNILWEIKKDTGTVSQK